MEVGKVNMQINKTKLKILLLVLENTFLYFAAGFGFGVYRISPQVIIMLLPLLVFLITLEALFMEHFTVMRYDIGASEDDVENINFDSFLRIGYLAILYFYVGFSLGWMM